MPKPIASPLRSVINWFHASHLRLLAAGLVAIGIIGAVSAFAAVQTTTMNVWVNPHPAMAGVQVTVQGAGCGGNKTVGGDGLAQFGGCRVGDSTTVSVPASFNGRSVPDPSRTFNMANNKVVEFNYQGSTPPPPPPPPPPGPTSQVKVWVNPRPTIDGTDVALTGAGCAATKRVDSNNGNSGAVIFGGCKVDQEVTVTVPKQRDIKVVDDIWNYRIGEVGDNDNVRKITVRKDDTQNVIDYHFYGGFTKSPVDKTAQIRVVLNPTDKTAGKLNVLIYGGKCAGSTNQQQTKPVGPDGSVTFGGCEVGAGFRVKLLTPGSNAPGTQFTDAAGTWTLGPNGPDRYLQHLDPKPNSGDISWQPTYEFTLASPPPPEKGSLTVKSFNDANCNKTQDASEAILPNTPYSYTGPNNAKADLNTGSAGENTTPNLDPGNYQVNTTLPTGFKACSDATQQVAVQSGQTATITFGFQAIPIPTGKGNVTALVYNDKNGNSVRDADDPELADATVTAAVTPITVVDPKKTDDKDVKATAGITLKTNDKGEATFADLPNAAYTVSAEPLKGFVAVTPAIKDVTVKDNTQSVEFGQQQVASPTPSNNPNNGGTSASKGGSNGGVVGAVAGALPKTGTAGLILFLTFLVSSGLYYGVRKFLHRHDTTK